MTFETFVQSDEKTRHDQKIDKDKYKDKDKDNDKDKDKDILRTPPKNHPRDLWPLRHLFRVMRKHDLTKKLTKTNTKTMTKTKTFWEHLPRAILETCGIWDTDYNSDNWEPEFITILLTWQLIVTLDSIRNSCEVFIRRLYYSEKAHQSIEKQNHVHCTHKNMTTRWKLYF